jgi:UDP-N-acetylmuramyl tripeptide synthase
MPAINPDWVTNWETKIDAVPNCAALNDLAAQMVPVLMKTMTDAVANSNLALALMTPPSADLVSIVNWITNFISTQSTAYAANIAQLAETTAIYTTLMAKIAAKAASFTTCTVPTPPTPPTP